MKKLTLKINITVLFFFSFCFLFANQKKSYRPAVYLTQTGYSLTLLVDDPILDDGIKISKGEENFVEPKVSPSGNAVVFEPKNNEFGEVSFTIFTKNYTIVALLRTTKRQNELDKKEIEWLKHKKNQYSKKLNQNLTVKANEIFTSDNMDKLNQLLSYRGERFPDIKQPIELKKEYKNSNSKDTNTTEKNKYKKTKNYNELLSDYSQIIISLDKYTKFVNKNGNIELMVNGFLTQDGNTYILLTLFNKSNINYKINQQKEKFSYKIYSGFIWSTLETNDPTINSKIINKIEPLEVKANSKAYLLYIISSFGFESGSFLEYNLKEKSGTRNIRMEFKIDDV